MTAALVEPVVEHPKTAVESRKPVSPLLVVPARALPEGAGKLFIDANPLVPVFVIGGMALIGALAFVGLIVMWLALRHSGVLAP
jgi:hypothetical protein